MYKSLMKKQEDKAQILKRGIVRKIMELQKVNENGYRQLMNHEINHALRNKIL